MPSNGLTTEQQDETDGRERTGWVWLWHYVRTSEKYSDVGVVIYSEFIGELESYINGQTDQKKKDYYIREELGSMKIELEQAKEQSSLTKMEIAGVKADVMQAEADACIAANSAIKVKKEIEERKAEISKAEVLIQSELILLTAMQALSLIQSCEVIILQSCGSVAKEPLDILLPRLKRSWKDVEGQFGIFDDFTEVPFEMKERIRETLYAFFTVLSNCHANEPETFTKIYVERIEKQIDAFDEQM